MQKKDKDFYTENEVRIGDDYITSHPHYYTSLNNAFQSYFDTYLDNKDSIISLVSYDWKRKNVGFNFSIKYDNIVTSIVDFHRFFELLIKDILSRIDPYLSVRVDSSSKDFINYILKETSANEFKTVEFSEAKNRLKTVLKGIDEKSINYEFKRFVFLFENESGLEELSWWRNRLIHNGSRMPNILSFDYLISQKVIPLVLKVLETEMCIGGNQFEPLYFKTASGIEIINEIIRISLKQEELSFSEGGITSPDVARKYIKLYLLKGLGRASMNYNKHLQINTNVYIEYHRLQCKDGHQFVKLQEKQPEYYKTNYCLCCNNETLVTFKEVYHCIIEEINKDLVWCQCLVCDYGVSNKIGNPMNYDLTENDIFF